MRHLVQWLKYLSQGAAQIIVLSSVLSRINHISLKCNVQIMFLHTDMQDLFHVDICKLHNY